MSVHGQRIGLGVLLLIALVTGAVNEVGLVTGVVNEVALVAVVVLAALLCVRRDRWVGGRAPAAETAEVRR